MRDREKAQNEKDEKEEVDGGRWWLRGVGLLHERAREGGVPLIPRYNAHITFPSP